MPCPCGNKGTGGKATFEVVTENGKSVFSSPSKPTAEAVARRYPKSKVQEVGKPTAPGVKVSVDKPSG